MRADSYHFESFIYRARAVIIEGFQTYCLEHDGPFPILAQSAIYNQREAHKYGTVCVQSSFLCNN